jgi:DNA-binding MarR family transcriptional regulator
MDATTLALLLTRLGRLNEQFLADHCRAHDTTPAELQVLMLLHHHRDGHLSPSAIGGFIVQTSGGLTATLRRLEEAGWIDRLPDPLDGRGRLVALTGDGASFHDTVFADLLDRYRLVFADLDDDAALDAVRALMRGFERLAGSSPSADWTYRPSVTTTT